MLTGYEIKQIFLNYFKQKEHSIVSSSKLIPADDPTLLFTNAGMVQFKSLFLGQEARNYKRAASSQKCVRAGGKHNDLDNVGYTARHHTFFEMLGTFSFGDYFKEAAIEYAWELLVQKYGLPVDKLWITVYKDDEQAARIWRDNIGLSSKRIIPMGEKDNFWSMGDTGPCGPCSEILIDQGEQFSCGAADCKAGCDCDRYLELWNLVFMQYERAADGKLTPLPKPSIDTGMGLERITAVLQGQHNNFDSDIFAPIISCLEGLADITYGENHTQDIPIRVIADHIRAITFLIADGVMPANDGRGYVLRRIIRRAARYGRKLGLLKPYLHGMVEVVADKMQAGYPYLTQQHDFISKVTYNEERRFAYTLEQGMKILDDLVGQAKQDQAEIISGDQIFKLYDTYGFPLDLTRDILKEEGLSYVEADFKAAMQAQRDRARSHWKGADQQISPVYTQLAASIDKNIFSGYEQTKSHTEIIAIIKQGESLEELSVVKQAELILSQTPFYAEKGGQATDTGTISGDDAVFCVEEVKDILPGLVIHKGRLKNGKLHINQAVTAKIDLKRRRAIAQNHTATHLLHAALRQVLGDHVHQAGSLVAPDRLRFDFRHFSALGPDETAQIELLINEHIQNNYPVITQVLNLQDALKSGAMALFDEKYGEKVRLVEIDPVSKELCGGTHTEYTGNIGLFKITAEAGIAAGIRRIEALTGIAAYNYLNKQDAELKKAAGLLKVNLSEVLSRIDKLIEQGKQQDRQIQSLQQRLAKSQIGDLAALAKDIKGVNVLAVSVSDMGMDQLRELGDMLRVKLGSAVVLLGVVIDERVVLLCMVSKDLTKKLHAGKIIKQIARITGGGGGGRADMAQAGGRYPEKLSLALDSVYDIISDMLN